METLAVGRIDWMKSNELSTSVMISAKELCQCIIKTLYNYSAILLISFMTGSVKNNKRLLLYKISQQQFRQACRVLREARRLLIYPEDISSLSQ